MSSKIEPQKDKEGKEAKPSQLDVEMNTYLTDIEDNTPEMKQFLGGLTFHHAVEIDVGSGRKGIILTVPFRFLKKYRAVQTRLVRELEKKFSGKNVVIVGYRRILKEPGRKNHKAQQKRPRSRTLTAVHDAILDDLVFPCEIVGKRTRYRLNGTRLLRVHLDPKEHQHVTGKLDTFSHAYKRLTGRDIEFGFE